MAERMISETVYLVIQATTANGRKPTSVSQISGLSVISMRKNPPILNGGERAVKLTISVPAASFVDPPGLTASVTFGADQVMEPQVEVTPVDMDPGISHDRPE